MKKASLRAVKNGKSVASKRAGRALAIASAVHTGAVIAGTLFKVARPFLKAKGLVGIEGAVGLAFRRR